ncbi:MAG TPA: phosphoribosyltransferase family protein [Acidimicrobiales bacterium]|nr:phosphoribosyltransferase family protein [Acidimicrobiales bacterium]
MRRDEPPGYLATIHPFRDRLDAGSRLAGRLGAYAGRDDVLVLGLPRGGIPVAGVVAEMLAAPMDALIIRKLVVPGREEVTVGAVGPGGVTILDRALMDRLALTRGALAPEICRESREMHRLELAYRGWRAFPELRGRTVVVVDDGVMTGSTMMAAVAAVRQMGPARVVVAVPIASPEAVRRVSALADEVVTVATPEGFSALGQWYDEFAPTTAGEVRRWLAPRVPAPA